MRSDCIYGPKWVCGVYLVISKDESVVYVGASTNCSNRFGWHATLLRNGKHVYQQLIPYWERKELEFKVVQKCSKEELRETEQLWMDKYPNRINIKQRADGKGYKASEAARKKISEAAKVRNADPEYNKMISERCKQQHADGSINISPESRAKTGEALRGRTMAPELVESMRQNRLENRDLYVEAGKKSAEARKLNPVTMSEETKEKMRISQQERRLREKEHDDTQTPTS